MKENKKICNYCGDPNCDLSCTPVSDRKLIFIVILIIYIIITTYYAFIG